MLILMVFSLSRDSCIRDIAVCHQHNSLRCLHGWHVNGFSGHKYLYCLTFSLLTSLCSAGCFPVASDFISRGWFVAGASSAEAGLWHRRVPSENQRKPW